MIKKYRTEKGRGQLVRLVCEEEYDYTDLLKDPRKIYGLMKKIGVLKDTEERMYLISLATSGKVKGLFEVSHGTVSSTPLNERGIAQRLLLSDGAEFIVVHNHPSGSTVPSHDDVMCSNMLKRLSEVIGVKYLDAIIVGNGYFSFYENGLIR